MDVLHWKWPVDLVEMESSLLSSVYKQYNKFYLLQIEPNQTASPHHHHLNHPVTSRYDILSLQSGKCTLLQLCTTVCNLEKYLLWVWWMLVMCNYVLGHLYYHSPYLYINRIRETTYHFSQCADIPLKASSNVPVLLHSPLLHLFVQRCKSETVNSCPRWKVFYNFSLICWQFSQL